MPADNSLMNPIPVNPYYAATEKVVAARRNFPLRKKPIKRAAAVKTWVGSEMAFMIGQWMGAGRGQAANTIQYRAGSGKGAKYN